MPTLKESKKNKKSKKIPITINIFFQIDKLIRLK